MGGTNGTDEQGEWVEGAGHCVDSAEDRRSRPYSHEAARRVRSFAYNLLRATGCQNIKNARWRAAIDINALLEMCGIR